MATTAYLDLGTPEDLALFPQDYQGVTELTTLLVEAFADLLAYYTVAKPDAALEYVAPDVADMVQVGELAVVALRGYAELSADADAGLRDALRRELVRLTVWKVQQRSAEPLLKSKSGGDGVGVSYRDDSRDTYPPGFGRWLSLYDARAVANGALYSI
jgi:hypothetical protein